VTPFNDAPQLRHALEEAVARRGVRAVVIDEAQHLMHVAGGAKLLDQLDWLKSMSHTMGVVHVRVGTYDLLDFRNLSGQTARRGHDLHVPRYQFQQEADQIAFQRALRGLLEHVPLQMDLQALMNHWYYFDERRIGCLGVLKDWLVRTLSATLYSGATTNPLSMSVRRMRLSPLCATAAAPLWRSVGRAALAWPLTPRPPERHRAVRDWCSSGVGSGGSSVSPDACPQDTGTPPPGCLAFCQPKPWSPGKNSRPTRWE
jgi:hypothetical protein